MRLVIASGKGGTGKTTLSVNLAVALAEEQSVGLFDCDVEEPDCHLYLKPSFAPTQAVTTPVPSIDAELCTGCGRCARVCEFNALLALPGAPLVMPELCHGCGACTYVCAESAITEVQRRVGLVGAGQVAGVYLRWGVLDVGEARATPVICATKDQDEAPRLDLVIVDAPPGTACPAVEALRGADYVLLVTEPTPFGLHDLTLAVDTVREIGLPCGVVINRAGIGDKGVEEYCAAENIPVLLQIPFDRRLAAACSRGEIFATEDKEFAGELRAMIAELAPSMEKVRPR